jgi:hypothetical protein
VALRTGLGSGINVGVQETNTVTSNDYRSFETYNSVPASTTVGSMIGFRVRQNTLAGGSTVTTQTGFKVEALTFGSTIYAFRSSVATAANRWNLYIDGTANNFLSGSLLIGTTADAGYKLLVSGSGASGSLNVNNVLVVSGSSVQVTGSLSLTGVVTGTGTNQYTGIAATSAGATATLGYGGVGSSGGTTFDILQNGSAAIGVAQGRNVAIGGGGNTANDVAMLYVTGSPQFSAATTKRGVYFFNTLTAAANNDTLIGLDINPTFSTASFTGVKNSAIRIGSSLPGNPATVNIVQTNNSVIGVSVKNTSNGNIAQCGYYVENDTSATGQFIKVSSGYSYKTILANDLSVYNGTLSGDISILNDYTSGKIKLTAGGASNPHVTLFSNGNLAISSSTDAGYKLLVSGSGASGSLNVDNTLYVTGSRVGIGTSAPSYPLDVTGSVNGDFGGNFQNNNTGTSARVFFQAVNNAGNYAEFLLNGSNYSATTRYGISGQAAFLDANVTTVMGVVNNNPLILGTNNLERLRIFGSTGNISVGTTTDSGHKLYISGSGTAGSLNVNNILYVSSSTVQVSGSNSRLLVVGSGSANPLLSVIGSQGELFSVNDTLSGSLFSVNDISGLPVLEAFSDNRVLLGSYQAPAVYTTVKINSVAGNNTIYQNLPTASYDGMFVSYTARSGSSVKVGQITGMWSASAMLFNEFGTSSFGDVSGLGFTMIVTSGNMAVTASTSTANWSIKTIVRSI